MRDGCILKNAKECVVVMNDMRDGCILKNVKECRTVYVLYRLKYINVVLLFLMSLTLFVCSCALSSLLSIFNNFSKFIPHYYHIQHSYKQS